MCITSLILYLALVASTDAKDADDFLKTLEKEKRDVLVPYAQKKIEIEIAKKQSSWTPKIRGLLRLVLVRFKTRLEARYEDLNVQNT